MASFIAHHHGSLLVEREGKMSAALRSSLRPREAAEEMAPAAASGPAAERGAGLFAEGFSVEDLLDLGDLCEVDKDGEELGEAAAPAPLAVEEDKLSSDSQGSSVVSYELMPLPPSAMDLSLPAHDAEELEWVSRIMDDSLAELPPLPRLPAVPPATAAEPLRTPTICALSTEALVPVRARRRSKRSRASVWSLSGAAPLSDSASSSSTAATTSSCSSSASFSPFLLPAAAADSSLFLAASQSHLLDGAPPRPKKSKHGKHGKSGKLKKRGRKPKHHQVPPQFAAGAAAAAPSQGQGDRRCSHCGVQKTPQWRAGPEGAKTLCNACGVRYKSGRLLPEYRPACSPTFVSTIHSNSHRKVLEMRRKKEGLLVPVQLQLQLQLPAAAPAVASF